MYARFHMKQQDVIVMRQNDLKGFVIPMESDTEKAPFDLLGTGEEASA